MGRVKTVDDLPWMRQVNVTLNSVRMVLMMWKMRSTTELALMLHPAGAVRGDVLLEFEKPTEELLLGAGGLMSTLGLSS